MCVYSDILSREQGITPEFMHVVLGDGTVATTRVDSIVHYFHIAQDRFEQHAAAPPATSVGAPCGHCAFCRWAGTCEAEWDAADHLSLVAGISRGQAEALRAADVPTLVALAKLPAGRRIPGMQPETFERLRNQARLQAKQRADDECVYELLDPEPGRGLARLPQPSAGDMFFDMEGDPLFDGGLEYLFGIVTVDEGTEDFHAFWAHDREEEKAAFQGHNRLHGGQARASPRRAHLSLCLL